MTKKSLLATAFLLVASTAAHAGGQAGSVGLGAEYELNGIGGASINYDAGQFHVGGFLGLSDPPGGNNTLFTIGGRFFWHLHKTAMTDFGLGGGLGIASIPPGGMGMGARRTDIFIEPGFQIRAFIASNVALSFTTGLVIGAADAGGLAITGQGIGGGVIDFGGGVAAFTAGAGIHYYFF